MFINNTDTVYTGRDMQMSLRQNYMYVVRDDFVDMSRKLVHTWGKQ